MDWKTGESNGADLSPTVLDPLFPPPSSELAFFSRRLSLAYAYLPPFPLSRTSLVTMIDYYSHHSNPSRQHLRVDFSPLSPKVVLDPVSSFR